MCKRELFLLDSSPVGRDSSVGMVIRYGLGGPGIEYRWGPPSLLYNKYRDSFPGVKQPGRGGDHPPHLAPRLKKQDSSPVVMYNYINNARYETHTHGRTGHMLCRFIVAVPNFFIYSH